MGEPESPQMDVYQPIDLRRDRRDYSPILLLVQQINEKLEVVDSKLTAHVSEELLKIAEEIASLMVKSFPEGDPHGHRRAHEAAIKAAEDKAQFWKTMRAELGKWGLIGFIGFAIAAMWHRIGDSLK